MPCQRRLNPSASAANPAQVEEPGEVHRTGRLRPCLSGGYAAQPDESSGAPVEADCKATASAGYHLALVPSHSQGPGIRTWSAFPVLYGNDGADRKSTRLNSSH